MSELIEPPSGCYKWYSLTEEDQQWNILKIKVCNNYTCWLMNIRCKHSIILRCKFLFYELNATKIWLVAPHAPTYPYVPLHATMYPYVSLCATTCPYVPLHATTCPYVPLCTLTCLYVLLCVPMRHYAPLRAPMCPYMTLCATTCPYMPHLQTETWLVAPPSPHSKC